MSPLAATDDSEKNHDRARLAQRNVAITSTESLLFQCFPTQYPLAGLSNKGIQISLSGTNRTRVYTEVTFSLQILVRRRQHYM